MTKEQIIDVCKKYNNILDKSGIKSVRENNVPGSIRHVKWMCEEIINLVNQNKLEKAFRWLGFVQGVFWTLKISNIEQLKDDNR